MTTQEILTKWNERHQHSPYQTVVLHPLFLELKQVCEESEAIRKSAADAMSVDSRVAALEAAVAKVNSVHKWKGYPTRKDWQEIIAACKAAAKV